MAREHDYERDFRNRGRDRYDREDRYEGEGRDDRDLGERLADEVRSWFGDEDAALRRRRDTSERAGMRPGYGHFRGRGVRDYDRLEGSRYPGYFRGTDPERDWDRYDHDEGTHATHYGGPGALGWAGGPWGASYPYRGPLIGGGRYGGRGEHSDWYEGRHFGRGPKEYQRSPERMREDAYEALTWHGGVDATHIVVKVEEDEITLEGMVNSRQEKRMAEDAVERVRGVRDVHNRLQIQRGQDQERAGG